MGPVTERLAEQPFGRCRIAQRRQQEVDRGAAGIDRSIQIAPPPVHADVSPITPPRFIGRLEMAAQPLVRFWTVALNPTPDGGVAGLQAALHQQFLDIAQGKRIPQVPTNRPQDELGFGLPPL